MSISRAKGLNNSVSYASVSSNSCYDHENSEKWWFWHQQQKNTNHASSPWRNFLYDTHSISYILKYPPKYVVTNYYKISYFLQHYGNRCTYAYPIAFLFIFGKDYEAERQLHFLIYPCFIHHVVLPVYVAHILRELISTVDRTRLVLRYKEWVCFWCHNNRILALFGLGYHCAP